jgi:hypothetical protein
MELNAYGLAVSRRAAKVHVNTVMPIAVGVVIGVPPVQPAAMGVAVTHTIAMSVWAAVVRSVEAGRVNGAVRGTAAMSQSVNIRVSMVSARFAMATRI